MDDTEIRILILEELKKIYDEHPHQQARLENLQNELTEAEVTRNVNYLEGKGLIDVQWFLGGDFIAKINSFGVDYLESFQNNVERKPKEIVLPSLINESITFVNKKLESLNPEILEKLTFIYQDLIDDTRNHPHNYARIAYDCREILMDFADAIYKDEYLPEGFEKPNRNQTKNKIKYSLKYICESKTERNLISQRYGYLINYFSELSDFIQKNAHPAGFKVTSEDAKICLIYTYLFMRDILLILD